MAKSESCQAVQMKGDPCDLVYTEVFQSAGRARQVAAAALLAEIKWMPLEQEMWVNPTPSPC